jgi:undecaprenyl-diphosphatase
MEKRNAKRTESGSEEKIAMQSRGISWVQALVIGFMQGIGTLPGISRSGSTIAGGQLSKLDRTAAGEYSFIISIPAILGAFVLSLKDYLELLKEGGISEEQSIKIGVTLAGCFAAFVSGYFALFFLMKLIKKGRLELFAFYLVPLGVLGMIFLK